MENWREGLEADLTRRGLAASGAERLCLSDNISYYPQAAPSASPNFQHQVTGTAFITDESYGKAEPFRTGCGQAAVQ